MNTLSRVSFELLPRDRGVLVPADPLARGTRFPLNVVLLDQNDYPSQWH
ncbi:MAG: hypothetical protein GXP31_02525 [Kiritimatiellaeota bacterium]|nr:hypothetical protein [Kiritimatiellota bacterium]